MSNKQQRQTRVIIVASLFILLQGILVILVNSAIISLSIQELLNTLGMGLVSVILAIVLTFAGSILSRFLLTKPTARMKVGNSVIVLNDLRTDADLHLAMQALSLRKFLDQGDSTGYLELREEALHGEGLLPEIRLAIQNEIEKPRSSDEIFLSRLKLLIAKGYNDVC